MSPQETQVLQDLLNQLVQVRGIAKDPQADALIASAVAQQPDAAYLLVQRALLVDQALTAAKAQIAALQSQVQAAQAAPARGFLDGANAWGNSAAAAPPRPIAPAPMAPSYPAPPMQAQAPMMQSPAQPAAPGFFGGGVGSMLGTVAATAAGVAGGAFLFQGIENLMGHHNNSASGFMNQPGMAPSATPVENTTTINNYYAADAATDKDQTVDDTASNGASDDYSLDDDSSLA
ncbi:DUF2076 domain-containing protein [Paraherbaspirillum soli]|uniref:DUF2076 domain-containing protein n=1 Tax=Paraherbaspirillum soli TaxID=631222 RepID=A0ABW0M390_9BURK